jgi:transmembrane sensor
MSSSVKSSIEIEELAAQWLAKRDSGDWSESDQAELTRWLASTAHRVAFIRLETAWQEARRLKALGAGAATGVVPPAGEWRTSPFFARNESASRVAHSGGRRSVLRALAASLVLAIVGATTWILWPTGSTYRTPIGGLATVPLRDGSKITLNTDSYLRVAVTERERRVELEQGEAYFEVAKDPQRPFVVAAGKQRVVAVGTAFAVRRVDDGVRVVVTDGRVRIEDGGDAASLPAHLSAGAIARADGEGVLIQEKPLPEAEEYLSWRSGYVVFRETPLAEAAAELNRYNERKIVIQDPQVAAIRISGNFRATNFEAFVRLIEEGFALSAHSRGDEIVLTKP